MASDTAAAPDAPRPDLTVPLPPAGPLDAVLRFAFAMPRRPAFDRAHGQSLWLVGGCVALIVLGQVALGEPATIAGIALALYASARAVMLGVLERRQYQFEPRWLVERSVSLRQRQFDVVRLTAANSAYDLTDPDEVRSLLGRAGETELVIDVGYRPSTRERTYRRLGDVRFEPVLSPGMRARAQFPAARYELRPSGRSTFWRLGDSLVLTVARPAGLATPHA